MKIILLLIFATKCLAQSTILNDSIKSINGNGLSTGISMEIFESKLDTIPALLLLCDTTSLNSSVHWMHGFIITEGNFYSFKPTIYIDSKKKRLPKGIFVWMVQLK